MERHLGRLAMARAKGARMTVRLDPATRRKVERLAAREGLSLNQALNRLLQSAPDDPGPPPRRRPYRLRPRRRGFGFEIADARRLAADLADRDLLRKLRGRRG
jgi:hypothetical protein